MWRTTAAALPFFGRDIIPPSWGILSTHTRFFSSVRRCTRRPTLVRLYRSHHHERSIYTQHPYGPYSTVPRSIPLIDIHSPVVHCIKSMDVYESLVYSFTNLLVCFFTSRCSTWGEILKPQFLQRTAEYHKTFPLTTLQGKGTDIPHVFLTIDVDDCPRAAYHSNVDDVPSICILLGDDAFRRKIVPIERYDASDILDQAFDIITDFDATSLNTIQSYSSASAWYDHHIRMDNLNVLRVGWPTS